MYLYRIYLCNALVQFFISLLCNSFHALSAFLRCHFLNSVSHLSLNHSCRTILTSLLRYVLSLMLFIIIVTQFLDMVFIRFFVTSFIRFSIYLRIISITSRSLLCHSLLCYSFLRMSLRWNGIYVRPFLRPFYDWFLFFLLPSY